MKTELTAAGMLTVEKLDQIGTRSTETCPRCGGVLWEASSPAHIQFQCLSGHAFNQEALLKEHDGKTAQAVWAAIRSFHEKEMLLQRLAASAREQNHMNQADNYEAAATAAFEYGQELRQLLQKLPD